MLLVFPFTISHHICRGPEGRHRKTKVVVGQRQIGWLRSRRPERGCARSCQEQVRAIRQSSIVCLIVFPFQSNNSSLHANVVKVITDLAWHPNRITGSKNTAILMNEWTLLIGGASSGSVCACSLRSRLVFQLFDKQPYTCQVECAAHMLLLFKQHQKFATFVSFILYSAILWFFTKRWIYHFEDTKSIVINELMYTLKFDNSPCGEISFSPKQRCLLQTGSNTSHDSMFRWSKCFKEERTKTVLSSHCTYDMFLHI